MRCPHCDTLNTPDARFCERCGEALAGPGDATLPFDRSAARPPSPEGPLLQLARRELADDYDVEKEVGRGGMAVVYRAVERALTRPVALKILPPELALGPSVVDRFKREAQMAASLDHPNIIPVYRVGQSGTLLYLAMRFVEGRALDAIIATQGALPVPVVVLILRAAAAALTYAHEHGIVHRDIKGGNILIDRDGRVIVSDFGVARAVESASVTVSGSMIGTPYFMSPEQCAGKVAGPQSDQYSLGVVAFQMLTGTVPFQAETLAAIMHHHFFTPVPDVSVARADVPAELTAVMGRVLTKDPAHRYPTTRDMLVAIEAIPLTEAERREGESMLRELANGASVRSVPTAALPPLADTMTVVAAQDAQRRSAAFRMRVRRWTIAVGSVAIAILMGVLISSRHAPASGVRADSAAIAAPINPILPPVAAASSSGVSPGTRAAASSSGVSPAPRAAASSGKSSRTSSSSPTPAPPVAPPVAPPGPPPSGKLRVRVLPGDAEIYVDGRRLGTGAVVDSVLLAGERRLHVVSAGYKSFDSIVTVVPDSTTVLGTVTLKPEP
jgi:serine/threonine protein kinase